MYYIITEDSVGSSGFVFYELLNKIYFSSKYTILSAQTIVNTETAGNDVLKTALEKCKVFLKQGDVLVIAYDNQITVSNKQRTDDQVEYIQHLRDDIVSNIHALELQGVYCFMTSYMCFEELLVLSDIYKYLSQDSNDIQMRQDYIMCLQNSSVQAYQQFLTKYNYKTIEKALAALLTRLTTEVKFTRFTIDKNHFGICWLKSCEHVDCHRLKYGNNNPCKFAVHLGTNVCKRDYYLFLRGKQLRQLIRNLRRFIL